MTTRAFDLVTPLVALSRLNNNLGINQWMPNNHQQVMLFNWLAQYAPELEKVTGLDGIASNLYELLNQFLTERQFKPVVQPFDPSMGYGVVSVLDKMVTWLNSPATKVGIQTSQGTRPGFELPTGGVNVYEVQGFAGSYLLELVTQSKDTLWLFSHTDNNLDGLDLAKLSLDVMRANKSAAAKKTHFGDIPFMGAQIPMIDFDIMPDLSWLVGAYGASSKDVFEISQAYQQFKLRMNEEGARVKVATTIAVMRSVSVEPEPFVLNSPFYGWFTQAGVSLPMAAFFADWDSFKAVDADLSDM